MENLDLSLNIYKHYNQVKANHITSNRDHRIRPMILNIP